MDKSQSIIKMHYLKFLGKVKKSMQLNHK